MTDQELSEAVARKLGWTHCEKHGEGWHEAEYPHCSDALSSFHKPWVPPYATSIAAAWEIVAHCKKDDKLANEFQWALFDATHSSDDSFEIFDITPRAICLAFLALETKTEAEL